MKDWGEGHVNGHSAKDAADLEHARQLNGNGVWSDHEETGSSIKVRFLEFDDEISVDVSNRAVVKGMIHPKDIGVIYGRSTVAKTFLALDLGTHVARGEEWHGHRVRRASVLFVGLEGDRGLRNRILAIREERGSAGKRFARLLLPAPLDKSERGAQGEATIIEAAKELAAISGEPVSMIIIDTLSRAIAGDDENSAADMSAFVDRMGAIARATGAAVLVVHHPGKDEARGMRGSTALFGAADVVIRITQEGEVREVETEKVKDGMIGRVLTYRLKVVELGTDEDGDQITSCIVEALSKPKAKRRRPPPESQAGKALGELEELVIIGKGEPADGHPRAPRGVLLIRKTDWRAACLTKELTADEAGEAAERRAFSRAVGLLERDNWIGNHGPFVWLLNDDQSMSQAPLWDMARCPKSSTDAEE